MNKKVASGLMVAGISLMLTVPAVAEGTTHSMGTNGTMTRPGVHGTYTGTGTGAGTVVPNTGYTGTTVPGNGYTTRGTTNGTASDGFANGGNYRTRAAANRAGNNWGWLGLLGLFGLLGMRSRNPERDRT